jgi:hypothetical protein
MTQLKHFITYGNDNFIKSKERINTEAINSRFFDTCTIYSPIDFDSDFIYKHWIFIENNKRLGGYALWKFYSVLKKLKEIKYNDILVYADAGCTINKYACSYYNQYISILNNSNYDIICIQLQGDYHIEYKWTKNDIFEFLKIEDKHKESCQIMSGIFYCRKTTSLINFFEKLYNICSENYNLIDDSDSITQNHIDFIENRHDQSLFSLLLKQYYNNKFIINDNTGVMLINGRRGYDITAPILGTRIRN